MVLLQLLVALIHEPSQQTFQSFSLIFNFALAKVPLTEVKVVRIWIKPFISLLARRLPWTCYSEGICTFFVFCSSGAHVCIVFVKARQRLPNRPASRFKTHADSYGGSTLRLHVHV